MLVSPDLFRPLLYRRSAAPQRTPMNALLTWAVRRFDAVAILLVWAASAILSLVLEPRHYEISTAERLYYTIFEVAVGAFVGFHLFDRLPRDGLALFGLRAGSAILFCTLFNEALVEPVVFGAGTIDREGVYYGLMDGLSVSGLFLLLRLAERLHLLQQGALGTASAPDGGPVLAQSTAAAPLFVRVAGGSQRLHAPAILYLAAERDFTRIVCVDGEYFVSESLKSLVARFADFGIVRIHKSFAASLGHVERLTRSEARVGGHRVPVGRRYRAAFTEAWRAQSARLEHS